MRMCERCMGLPTAQHPAIRICKYEKSATWSHDKNLLSLLDIPARSENYRVSKINSDINFFSSNLCIFSILIKKGFIDNANELNRNDTKMKISISYKDATNRSE